MKLIGRMLGLAAIALLAASPGLAAEAEGHGPAAPSDARFEFLKQLEGTWVGESDSAEMPGGSFEFRVTAGGHAVEEREMVGTPMEMLTVYHMDGKDLVATHYCMLGNQPRFTAAKKVVGGKLDFACSGKPGNSATHDDEHIHGWAMQLTGDGTLHYSANMVKAGEVTKMPTFVLTRDQKTASR